MLLDDHKFCHHNLQCVAKINEENEKILTEIRISYVYEIVNFRPQS